MGIGRLVGGALQGIGAGMMQGAMEEAKARREMALAALREKRTETVGPGERVIDLDTGRVIAEGAAKTPERGRIITPQPGAGAYRENADGTIEAIVIPNDGSKQFGQRVESGPATGSAPAAAAEYLRQNPQLAEEFDRKYGAGASARVLGQGGPTGNRSGGFLQ